MIDFLDVFKGCEFSLVVQQSPDLVTVDLVKNLDLVKFSLLTEFLCSKNCRFSEDLETLEPRFSEVFSEFSKKN